MSKRAAIVSDGAFFVKTIDAPLGLPEKDYPDFIDTAIETLSPLPLEKLRRGYVKKNGGVVVFAGLGQRVYGDGQETDFASYSAVVPAAAVFVLSGAFAEGAHFLKSGNALSLIVVADGRLENFAASETGSLSDVDCASRLADSLGLSDIAQKSDFWTLISCESVSRASYKSVFEKKPSVFSTSEPERVEFEISPKSMSAADIRDRAFLKTAGTLKRKEKLLELAVLAIPLIAAVLVVFQVAVLLKSSKVASISEELSSIEPRAKSVEALSEQVAELSVFNGARLHSIKTLAQLNICRPDEVAFGRMVQNSPFNAEVQGTAPTLGSINTYLQAVKKSGDFDDASAKTEVNRGAAKFTLSVKIKKP